MTAIISFINYKRGSGKTSAITYYGLALAAQQKKVLIIDTDYQKDLEEFFCSRPENSYEVENQAQLGGIYRIIADCIAYKFEPADSSIHQGCTAQTARKVIQTKYDNIALLAQQAYLGYASNTFELARMLEDYCDPSSAFGHDYEIINNLVTAHIRNVASAYDVVLIDTPSCAQTIHSLAINASDYLVMPIKLDYYGVKAVHDTLHYMVTIIGGRSWMHKVSNVPKFMGYIATTRENPDAIGWLKQVDSYMHDYVYPMNKKKLITDEEYEDIFERRANKRLGVYPSIQASVDDIVPMILAKR